jgi:hypothetical protein
MAMTNGQTGCVILRIRGVCLAIASSRVVALFTNKEIG